MRLQAVGLLVALGALLAACGGGGKSLLPSAAQPAASAAAPGQQATKHMAIVLNVPPASKQSKARKPFFISPNTLSVAIAVVPNGSGTPTPSELQVFPVTTPSPCATTGAGGETCTFNVTAPYGTDIFYVATFAVASPNPASTTVPLASFVSGAIVISSPGPGPTPSPLAFTLNGVVNSVVLTVPSPDPSNTPNTQVLVAASPTTLPLGITPYDSSGAPILADAFLAPIPIIVTPQGQGVGLTMTATCSTSTGSTTPTPVVDVGCAADLANVQIAYPGTIFADANAHIVDTFSIAASQMASPAPSPANVVLASERAQRFAPARGARATISRLSPGAAQQHDCVHVDVELAHDRRVRHDQRVDRSDHEHDHAQRHDTERLLHDERRQHLGERSATTTICSASPMRAARWRTPSASPALWRTASDVTFDGTKVWASGMRASPAPSPDVVAYAPLTGTCAIGALASTVFGRRHLSRQRASHGTAERAAAY